MKILKALTLAATVAALPAATLSSGAKAGGIPSLRGGDHFGFTVPDLQQAVAFFKDVIGCEEFYPLGPFADDKGTWMADHLNVHPRAKIDDMRLMRCGHGNNLEIFQYDSPDQNRRGPKNSDVGGHHIAFYVDDMAAAVTYLRGKDVQILGEPSVTTQGPSAGEAWVYFLAPWGMQLELVSYPKGKAYEKDYDGRLWSAISPCS